MRPPSSGPQSKESLGEIARWVAVATKGMRGELIVASLFTALATFVGQLVVQAISSIMTILQTGGQAGAVEANWPTRLVLSLTGGAPGALVALFGFLIVAGILVSFFSKIHSAGVDFRMMHDMRRRIHRSMLDPLLLRKRGRGEAAGDRVSLLERQLAGAQPMLREIFTLPITRGIPLVTALILLVSNLPSGGGTLAVYLILGFGIIASPLAGIWLAGRLRSGTQDLEIARSRLTGETIVSAANPDVFIALGAVETRQSAYVEASSQVVRATARMRTRQELASQIQTAIVPAVQFALIAYAILLPGGEAPNIGAIFAIYNFVPAVINPVREIVTFTTSAYQSLPIIKPPALALSAETVDLDAGAGVPAPAAAAPTIAVNGLTILGDGEGDARKTILSVPSCVIEGPGAVVVIGASGSGKSTLLRAVARLSDYADGAISLRGADLNAVSERSLRAAVGSAEQFPLLLEGDLRANLRLAEPGADDEALAAAIREWGMADFLARPGEGASSGRSVLLDRLVKSGGRDLFSGGERRVMSLVRAGLGNQDILLLDEPTTGMDAGNVNLLADGINLLKTRKLVLFVDHNLDFVRKVADRVIYMVSGRIEFQGPAEAFFRDNEKMKALMAPKAAAGQTPPMNVTSVPMPKMAGAKKGPTP